MVVYVDNLPAHFFFVQLQVCSYMYIWDPLLQYNLSIIIAILPPLVITLTNLEVLLVIIKANFENEKFSFPFQSRVSFFSPLFSVRYRLVLPVTPLLYIYIYIYVDIVWLKYLTRHLCIVFRAQSESERMQKKHNLAVVVKIIFLFRE